MFKIKKLDIIKKKQNKAKQISSNDNNLPEKQVKSNNSIPENVLFTPITFEHEIDGELFQTTCPAMIIDDSFVYEKCKSERIKKTIVSNSNDSQIIETPIPTPTIQPNKNNKPIEIIENEFWESDEDI
jgi:hypothetical protein